MVYLHMYQNAFSLLGIYLNNNDVYVFLVDMEFYKLESHTIHILHTVHSIVLLLTYVSLLVVKLLPLLYQRPLAAAKQDRAVVSSYILFSSQIQLSKRVRIFSNASLPPTGIRLVDTLTTLPL